MAIQVQPNEERSISWPAELVMGLLFRGDEREDFVAMIDEIAERVEDLKRTSARHIKSALLAS